MLYHTCVTGDLSGIQFVSDNKGRKVGVLIDLRKHRRLWEDFWDVLEAKRRSKGPKVPWEKAKKELRKHGKLGG